MLGKSRVMPKLALPAVVALALAAAAAQAQDGVPERGTTFTLDSDVTQYRPSRRTDQMEIYILRGTAKESRRDPAVVVQNQPETAKTEPQTEPQTKKGFRGRGRINVPDQPATEAPAE